MEADVAGPLLPVGAPSHPEHTGRPVASVPARCPHWVAQGAGGKLCVFPASVTKLPAVGVPPSQASF